MGLCEQVNELSNCTKDGEFFDQLCECQLLKRESTVPSLSANLPREESFCEFNTRYITQWSRSSSDATRSSSSQKLPTLYGISVPCSQEPITSLYPKPDESSSHPISLGLILYFPPTYAQVLQAGLILTRKF
jgi:hypothetical protein